MHIVPKDEMIDCETWYDLVDYHYKGADDLPGGVVHCDMQSIPDFFEKISQTNNKYIVVSSRSDFSLFYQKRHPPFRDYAKVANMFIDKQNSNMGYQSFTIPPPINLERCKPDDKYSIKAYLYTEATFNTIPQQVHSWLVCNNGVLDDPRIIGIPFGFNGVDGSIEARDKIAAKNDEINWTGDRIKELYVNFAFYTNQRAELYDLYNRFDWVTAEQDKIFDEYIGQLTTHNMVLCPPGNGLDCYRTLEALYLGCIPVMELNPLAKTYINLKLPVLFLESLESVTQPVIDHVRNAPICDRSLWNLTSITKTFWKKVIDELRQQI